MTKKNKKPSDKEYKKILEKNKEYYNNNKSKRKKKMLKYYHTHKKELSKYKQTYYEKNKEHAKQKAKEYRDTHKEERKIYFKNYWKNNQKILRPLNAKRSRIKWKRRSPEQKKIYRIKKNAYEKQRRQKDLNFALKKRLRLRVWQAFNGIRKKSSDELGINYTSIIKRLKETLPADYKDNPSKYEIDHVIPLDSFNLTKSEEVKKAFAPENHQWLTAFENAAKSNLLPEEWKNTNPKGLYTTESNNNYMNEQNIKPQENTFKIPENFKKKTNKRKTPRPTDLNPSYSHIAGDPTKNERINFKHWNDLLFGKDDDNDTTYSNLWLYRNPQKVEPFRDDIGSPSQTQAKTLGKTYFSEFNPLISENIINFWSDENDTILDPFAGRTRGYVAGLKHRH